MSRERIAGEEGGRAAAPGRLARGPVTRIVLAYSAFGALWILLSDRLAAWLLPDPGWLALAGTLKGWVYVAVTAVLLYALLRCRLPRSLRLGRGAEGAPGSELPTARSLLLPLAAIGLVLAVLVAAGVRHSVQGHRGEADARIQAISDLAARRVADWLADRQRQAEFLRGRMMAAHALEAAGTPRAAAALAGIREYLDSHGWAGARMHGPDGELAWSLDGVAGAAGAQTALRPELAQELAAAVQRASRAGRVFRWEPSEGGRLREHSIWLVPLPGVGGAPAPVVVLDAGPSDGFLSSALSWPVPTRTGETLILRRQGEILVPIARSGGAAGPGAGGPDATGAAAAAAQASAAWPIVTAGDAAARVLRGELAPGRVDRAVDARGADVIGVAQRIEGSDWLLMTRIERAEALRDASGEALWIVVSGAALLLVASAAAFLARQRQTLDATRRERDAQGERLRTMRLLDAIVDSSGDAILAKDREGRYLMFSREAQRLCGRTASEAIGRDDGAIFPAAEAAMIQASDGEAMESGRVIRTEEILTTALGRRVFLSTRAPLHDADGAVAGVICISRDITERKQAEEALRESDQRWIMAIEGAGHGVWDWNLVDDTAWLSEQWTAMLGYAPGEIGGGTSEFFGRLHPEDVQSCRQALDAHLRGAAPMYRSEVRLRCRDGSYRWVLVQGRLVSRTRDGRPLRMIGTHTDVSASHAVREELRKLWLAVAQSPNSIMITDAQARIEYVNDALCRVSGFARAELLGRNPRMLHSGRTPAATYRALWATLSRGEVWKGELLNRRPSGEVYVEFALISPVRQADGSVTHYLAIKEDITERKRIGQELDRHRHRLEELVAERTAELAAARRAADAANQAKSGFLANISHEIRTPMNAIVGLTHLLRQEETTPAQAARLDGIDTAVRFLLSIVNDVLDLSKIEAGRVELESTPFSPGEVLRSVHDMIAEQARARGLALRLETGELPAAVMGDPTRLRQALLNFASNAVKFTERGSIALRAGQVRTASDAGTVRLSFEVEDTGIGIEADKLARIFEPFEQADGSTSRRFGGTGLGLAITRRLAALMGGEVAVRSAPGQGSVFSIEVPFGAVQARGSAETSGGVQRCGAAQPAADAQPSAGAPPAAAWAAREQLRGLAGRARILVADDNAVNREVATALLQDAGLAADAVGDGLDALEAVQRRRYDLVLMDLHMPGLGGLEATRRIRALPGARLPVVALTASAFAEDRAACLAAGMDDFLAKPVDPALLHATIWRILGHGHGHGAGASRQGGLQIRPAGDGFSTAATPTDGTSTAADAPGGPGSANPGSPGAGTAGDRCGPPGGCAHRPEPGVPARRFEALRARLVALLEQGDLAAGALARAERSLLEHALGEAAARLFGHLEAYDHDSALRLLAAPAAPEDALKSRSPTPQELNP